MSKKRKGSRTLKKEVFEILKSEDMDQVVQSLHGLSECKVITPLFSFLHHTDERIKWTAVRALGAVTAVIADSNMETARVILRRLMWNLNDESGGIGWGSPEAMGEILASHEALAQEFSPILFSYARENGNYLEHEMLQFGLLWGIGRLLLTRPHLMTPETGWIAGYLRSGNAFVRGTAAWVAGIAEAKQCCSLLEDLSADTSRIRIYRDGTINLVQVKELAQEAMQKIKGL